MRAKHDVWARNRGPREGRLNREAAGAGTPGEELVGEEGLEVDGKGAWDPEPLEGALDTVQWGEEVSTETPGQGEGALGA